MRKFFVILLCLIFTFSFSAPRAAATGVGAGLTAAEMAGVISVIAASLGVTFMSAEDMQTACNAFVGDVLPGSPTDVLLRACGVSDGYIYLRGEIAKTEMMAVISAVRSFFAPGGNVVVSGSGSTHITNLGQIYQGNSVPAPGGETAIFYQDASPVMFYDENGNEMVSATCTWGNRTNTGSLPVYGTFVYPTSQTSSNTYYAYYGWPDYPPYYYIGVNSAGYLAIYIAVYNGNSGYKRYESRQLISATVKFSSVHSVSGGGEPGADIAVFQEAGALSPDLVGGVWDQLAQDADEQNGNVIIDTNTPSFQGGSSGLIPGVPDNNLVNPQQGALDSIGSTKTETDTSTGTQTQTQTQTGAQAVPHSATANPAISDTKAETSFNGVALTLVDIFPFCIPFDVYAMITSLAAPRETPTFDVRLFYPGWVDYTYTFDFSDFDNIAAVLRTAELGAFCVGLAAATRKFIKW